MCTNTLGKGQVHRNVYGIEGGSHETSSKYVGLIVNDTYVDIVIIFTFKFTFTISTFLGPLFK